MTNTSPNYSRTRRACYFAYLAMSSVFSLPPLLFVTFREMYGISYTMLGTLVLINFCTQLGVDLVFTFFTKLFNVKKVLRVMPLLTSAGFLTYALIPTFFPSAAYFGFVVGTFIFSVAAGLCEVLLSSTVASLPSDNPDRDMSMLHSLYAWGVLMVVGVSTLFLWLFGRENWMYLTLIWAALPIVSHILFCTSPIPDMDMIHSPEKGQKSGRTLGMALCVACIFLGSCAENAMTNWISGYMEKALVIPKALGDIFGLALFAMLLGLVRTAYAKYGKNISKVLLLSMIGAVLCYVVAAISPSAAISAVACVATGICTSMLWPGSLIYMEEKFPGAGVTAYALMAAGGDFGGSMAPQLMGVMVDKVAASSFAADISVRFSISAEQVGMKVAMLTSAIFPILGVIVLLVMIRYFKRNKA